MRPLPHQRSIAFRLAVSFLVTLLAMAAMAALAVYGFAQLAAATRLTSEHHLQETTVFDDIRLQIADAVHQDRAYARTGDPVFDEAFKADMEEIVRLFAVHAALHHPDRMTAEEERGIVRLRRAVDGFAAVHEEVDELFSARRRVEAAQLADRRGRQAAAGAVRVVTELVALERHEAAEQAARAAAAADRIYRLIIITIIAVAVVTGGVALSVTRSLTVPVARLVDTMRHVDRDTLGVRAGLNGGDEIGELARHFDHMVARLEATFQEQERFLSEISHELRTSITIIRGHLEILLRGTRTPDQVGRALDVSLDELERMGRLVDDFLMLARASRPGFLQMQDVPLRPFLAALFEKASGLAPRRWRLGNLADALIVADPERLTEAILNLVRNAADHTTNDEWIELSSRVHGGVVEILVSDGGQGIAAGDLPHIFERFYRGTSSRAVPGSGLGLSIVQSVIAAHGGTVLVFSLPGQGTTFTIRLPKAGPTAPVGTGVERSNRT